MLQGFFGSSFRFKYRQYALSFCQENKFNSNKELKILVVLAFVRGPVG